MSEKKIRVVHYINQFFAGVGGEEKADCKPFAKNEPTGPGVALKAKLAPDAEIVGTVVCGDGYYGEHTESAREACLSLIKDFAPDVVIAGPAFAAGRYGFACGDVASSVTDRLGVPAFTAMYEENPGVELYAKKTYILPCGDNARGMAEVAGRMAEFAKKLLRGEVVGPARVEGYFPRGVRKNFLHEKSGGERAVEMLLSRLSDEPFRTEYEMPVFNKIPPAPALKDLSKATIALVCSGGIVPAGNPDRIRVSSAESFGVYDISGVDDLTPDKYESIHGGYERAYANHDPDVILPLDVMRAFEKQGVFAKLHDKFYSTTGTGTAVSFAEKFGREIGEELKNAGVDAVILTST